MACAAQPLQIVGEPLDLKPTRKWSIAFYGRLDANLRDAKPEAQLDVKQADQDYNALELDLGGMQIRGKGKQLVPAISMRSINQDGTTDSQGFHLATLSHGASMSLYRRKGFFGPEMQEWLRISYAGIKVADPESGELKPAFTGRIRPGCSAVVIEGIITGEECPPEALADTKLYINSTSGTYKLVFRGPDGLVYQKTPDGKVTQLKEN